MELVVVDVAKNSVDWRKVGIGEEVTVTGKIKVMGVEGFVSNLIECGQKFEMIKDVLTDEQKEILDMHHEYLDKK